MTHVGFSRRAALCGLTAAFVSPPAFAAAPNILEAAMAGTRVPGMAALVIRNFRAEREIVAGVRRLGQPDPIERGDRWLLGSDGKAMTATLIARLVARGVLSWSAPLERLLPDLASAMRAEYRDVTLLELLSHRAGLPNSVTDEFLMTFVDDQAPLPVQRRRYIENVLTLPPAIQARTTHLYSNNGYVIAGAIAEHATGEAYEALMQRHIFQPLGIRSATYTAFGGPDEPIGHVEGRIADQRLDPNPAVISPSAGMRISMRDWGRFCIDQLKGDQGRGRLMPSDGYRVLHQPQGDTNYALGWYVHDAIFDRRGPALFHSGSDGNWIANALLFPREGDGVLVVANSAYRMDGNTVADAVMRQIAASLSEPASAP